MVSTMILPVYSFSLTRYLLLLLSQCQVQGCWAIANLALSEKGNDSLLVRIGGMDVVTASMKAFPTDRDVQYNGLGALGMYTPMLMGSKSQPMHLL